MTLTRKRGLVELLVSPAIEPSGAFPIRVLMTADTIGGVWNYSINLIRALASYGIEVVLATMGRPPSADQMVQARTTSNLSLLHGDFKLEWMNDPWSDVNRAGEWLLQLEADWRPALIHVNGYSHASLPWHAPRMIVAHSCVLSWWNAVRREPAPDEWSTYIARVSDGLSAANAVIAPTAAMLSQLRKLYGWSGSGAVIWNGLAPSNYRAVQKENFILMVGRLWDEAKNVAALESIAPQLPWPVYVAGEDRMRVHSTAVNALGYLPGAKVSNWMMRAAIYALPARYEPFGLSILEAAVSGCALVVGDIPSLHELWGDAAWFVAPDDRSELRRALLGLTSDGSLRAKFALRARQRSRQFGLDQMARQYVAVYRKLVGGRRACV